MVYTLCVCQVGMALALGLRARRLPWLMVVGMAVLSGGMIDSVLIPF